MSGPLVLKTIEDEKNYPYMFRNDLVSKDTYIVQKCRSLQSCLYTLDIWNREKYNCGDTQNIVGVDIPYTKYLYESNTKIYREDIDGGNEEYKVLIYKKDGIKFYNAMLKYK